MVTRMAWHFVGKTLRRIEPYQPASMEIAEITTAIRLRGVSNAANVLWWILWVPP